jgi:hypothetical protein
LLMYSTMERSHFLVVVRAILELMVCALLAEVKLPSITCQVSLAVLHAVTWDKTSLVMDESRNLSTC